MTGIFVVCASVAAVGVDYGWQPVAGGGIEYIIQIEPQMLDSLRAGQDIFSDLPRTASNIRSYRITAGTGPIPHGGEPLPAHEVNRPGARPQVGPSFRGTTRDDAKRARAERPAGGADEHQAGESQAAATEGDLLPGPVLEPPHSLASDDETPEEPAATQPNHDRSPRRLVDPPSKPLKHELAATAEKSSQRATKKTASRPAKSSGSSKQTAKSFDAKAAPTPSTAIDADKEGMRPNLTLLGLFASLGCNAFLLWVATGQRSRYRALARRLIP